MPRWSGIFRRRSTQSENNKNDPTDQCYACTRIGIPVFHSTSCDPTHLPEWEALAGSSLIPIKTRPNRETSQNRQSAGPFDVVFDPRSETVQKWNRVVLMARGIALAVDPVFFFSLGVGRNGRPWVYVDGGVAAIVAVVRTCVDTVQLCHLLLQFRLAYVSRESLVVGCGKLVWDARAIGSHHLRSVKAFWFDAFVIVPIPQVVYWVLAPKLIGEQGIEIEVVMTILELIFLFQFIPKVYHSFSLMQRMRKVTGYVFGTIWWRFALNLIACFLASHAAGGFWYILSIQRIASCLSQQNYRSGGNDHQTFVIQRGSTNFTIPKIAKTDLCFDESGAYFPFGIYQFALPLISTNSTAVKIIYSDLWGLMALSTMGNNLEPTSRCSEVLFCIGVVLGGLMLFTLLIGNIQVFLHAVTARKRKMQVRYQDMQWWMRRRQLPVTLRKRVCHFERQRWATMGGVEDEMELIKDLPQGLRRDIKRYLCLDLIKKVPLFQCLDDLILDNICDRVKPLVFSKGEKIMREGDPVQKMIFIVHGRVKRSQTLSKGTLATTTLQPGTFLGDELLSWCLRRPFIDRLPSSNATFKSLQPTEAFSLEFDDLRYISDNFRYRFANEKVKRTARYYSSNWRNWAAVNIQFAWRRYRTEVIRVPVSSGMENGGGEMRLQRYAAVFMSIRPHDHLE